jgi:hypothetical protein
MKRLLFLSTLAVLVLACQKELSRSKADFGKLASLQQFFEKNTAPVQTGTADASAAFRFTTAKGTAIDFPNNAFVTPNNQPVTGTITIAVKEIRTPAEMILNNTPTMSDGLPLVSGGEFFVRATQNGERLKLAAGKYVQINLGTLSRVEMAGMQVFNGDTTSGTMNWMLNTQPTNVVVQVQDSLVGGGSNSVNLLFADSLEWINCDKYIDEPKITYTVDPGNTPNVDSTAVFVHLTGRNAIMRFPKVGDTFAYTNMIATEATVVGICVMDGTLYYAINPVVTEPGGATTLNFKSISEEALKMKLAELN